MYLKNNDKKMEKKIRKPGSGIYPHKKRENTLKGSYKIYGLIDPNTEDIMYIGLTKQWISYRLNKHIDDARKLNSKTDKDNWIRSLLNEGKKPRVHQLEKLNTQDEREAKLIENEYIKKYGITNIKLNTFEYTKEKKESRKIDRTSFINKLKDLKLQGKTNKEVANELNVKRDKVLYWTKKLGIDKQSEIREQNRWIKELLNRKYTIKKYQNHLIYLVIRYIVEYQNITF